MPSTNGRSRSRHRQLLRVAARLDSGFDGRILVVADSRVRADSTGVGDCNSTPRPAFIGLAGKAGSATNCVRAHGSSPSPLSTGDRARRLIWESTTARAPPAGRAIRLPEPPRMRPRNATTPGQLRRATRWSRLRLRSFAARSGCIPDRNRASSAYKLPKPAITDCSSSKALIGAFRPARIGKEVNRERRLQRFGSHFAHRPRRVGQQPKVPELAGIDEAHLPPVVQREGMPNHGRRFTAGIVDAQAARHAKVHDQVLVVVQRCDQILTPPPQIRYASAGDPLNELADRGLVDRFAPGDIRSRETAADQPAADQVLTGVFDLWKFRHMH